ncbi:MAG: hypothetical protein ACLR6W_12010 [Evtepia sp.]
MAPLGQAAITEHPQDGAPTNRSTPTPPRQDELHQLTSQARQSVRPPDGHLAEGDADDHHGQGTAPHLDGVRHQLGEGDLPQEEEDADEGGDESGEKTS